MKGFELSGTGITYLRPTQSRLRRAVEMAIWLSLIAVIGLAIYGFAITHTPLR